MERTARQLRQPRAPTFVVGYDLSETSDLALRQAVAFATLIPGATIHVAWVAQPSDLAAAGIEGEDTPTALSNRVKSVLSSYAAQGVRPLDPNVKLHVRWGAPAESLAKLAFSVEADLIIVGTHGRHGVRRMVLGSVAEEVVRSAPCPVLVSRPRAIDEVPEVEPPPRPGQDREIDEPHTYHGSRRRIQPKEQFPLTVPMPTTRW